MQVEDINAGGDSNADDLVNVNGTAFFKADDGNTGEELWKSAPPFTAATTSVIDIRPGSESSELNFLEEVGGALFFRADDGVSGDEPWRSDGGAGGRRHALVADINPGPDNSSPLEFEGVNGTAFFRAFGPVRGIGAVEEHRGGRDGRARNPYLPPTSLTNVAGTLFFEAVDGGGQELWKATIEPAPPVQPGPPAADPEEEEKCKKAKKKKKGKAAAAKKKKKCKKKKRK